MKLEVIITLANRRVELYLRALERSLRATGSRLPLLVIPYDDSRFDLPAGASWLEEPELYAWLAARRCHPTMRKYAALLRPNFLFVDTDIVFLSSPGEALLPHSGFVTNCGHWRHAGHTVTAESRAWLAARSTLWERTVFNTGQWACDRALFTLATLRAAAETLPGTTLDFPYHEQPGVNYLVHYSGVPITNLTLPPANAESSWAGDYLERTPPFWADGAHAPFLMHWAGRKVTGTAPVDELMLRHLEPAERALLIRAGTTPPPSAKARLRGFARGVRDAWRSSFG
jgi:hypothetical protein